MEDSQRQRLRDHLVVALDVERRDDALELVEALGDRVARYKVGPVMFTRYGPEILGAVADRGAEIFLDLKFHDIPNTVAGSVEVAAERDDIFMMTIHASGGREMIRRAADAAGDAGPEIIAVTAMTSLDARDVRDVAGTDDLNAWAKSLAGLALESGADGLVCSAREAAEFRSEFGRSHTLVTPGIRPAGSASDDQKRAVTPAEGIDSGSDFLVIGRPIYQADDPVAVVESIGESLQAE